jgi:UDP:flavonoid glycosyltransferase YjiC (YdhE family)
LFVLWDGGGNVPPQLTLARRLVERGHSVRVLTEDVLAGAVVAAGCRFEGFVRAPNRADPSEDLIRDWAARTPLGAFARARDNVVMGPAAAYAADTRAALDREPVDALVADYMLFGVPVAGEAAGVATAAIVHHIYIMPEAGKPAPGPGFLPSDSVLAHARDRLINRIFLALFNRGLGPVNQARSEQGLGPLRHVFEQRDHVDLVLVLTSESFDFHGHDRPRHLRYVGPVLSDPEWVEPWRSPWPDSDERPLVTVSFSSTYMAQEQALARVIRALGDLAARVLVTTGPAIDPTSLKAAGNTVVVRSAPHAELFPQAAVVVTHAGMGTVTRALVSGVPLLCLPMGRDQLDVAARVVHAGAGLRLRPGASPAAIKRAVRRLLDDPSFRESAGRVGAQMRADAQEGRDISELEALAERSALAS